MLGTFAKSALVGMALGAAIAIAAAPQGLQQGPAKDPNAPAANKDASGASTPVPPGKVRLPELPLAPMPDVSVPKPPPVAPLPDQPAPERRIPRQI